uniref:Hereditary hemochromatosis protein homolog n=1 Tax=Sinocyclocheilus rhinocerous TaxID=307959 RepID=A0A673NIR1_9TELE
GESRRINTNVWMISMCAIHAVQFIGCAFNNEGQVSRFWRYGYDGRDIMHVDLAKEAVVATSEPGQLLAEERKSKEYIKRKEARLSNNSLSRAAKPAVYVSSGGEKDQEYLKCAVHGFYPNIIRVRWTQNRRPVYFGVSTTGVLPHKDGTFQMISYLSLSNVSAQSVTCEIEHLSIDGILRIAYGKSLTSA